MSERLFKVLNVDGTPYFGGRGSWPLPGNNRPGRWTKPIEGELIPCERGYHVCRPQDLLYWLGPEIFEVETSGTRLVVDGEDSKVVVRRARLLRRLDSWNDRSARLFAADCAEHVLPIYERAYPDDDRPRNAIAVARRFATGDASAEEADAARDAAWAAARDTVSAAAWAAAWAADRGPAWGAARGAAQAAPWAVAWDAERQWQAERLMDVLGVNS